MDQNTFDALIDNATHAVINLIPAEQYHELDAEQREGLTVQINDYLSEALALFTEN